MSAKRVVSHGGVSQLHSQENSLCRKWKGNYVWEQNRAALHRAIFSEGRGLQVPVQGLWPGNAEESPRPAPSWDLALQLRAQRVFSFLGTNPADW